MSHPSDKQSLPEIDLARAIAIIAMIIYHLIYLIDFFAIHSIDLNQLQYVVFARLIQFTFMGLVGISLTIAARRYPAKTLRLRALKIFGFGLIITAITSVFVPDRLVIFGILHLIGTGLFIFSFFPHKKYLALTIALASIIIGHLLYGIQTTSKLATILGLHNPSFASVDHFSLCPWLSVIAVGVYFGNQFYKNQKALTNFKLPKTLRFISKYSLEIYLLHIPVLILLLHLFFGVSF